MSLLLTIRMVKMFEISTVLANKVHRITVHQRFSQSGPVNRPKSFGRQRTGRTKSLANLVKRPVKSQNTRKSSRTMVNDFLSVPFFRK